MMPLVRMRQGLGRALFQKRRDSFPFRADPGEGEDLGARPGDDDEIDAWRQQIRPGPEALAAQPLHPVALDGPADLARYDEAHPRRTRHRVGDVANVPSCARRDEQREVRRIDPAALPLRTHELFVLAKPVVRSEGEPLGWMRGGGR
jgi:hypothetical protein